MLRFHKIITFLVLIGILSTSSEKSGFTFCGFLYHIVKQVIPLLWFHKIITFLVLICILSTSPPSSSKKKRSFLLKLPLLQKYIPIKLYIINIHNYFIIYWIILHILHCSIELYNLYVIYSNSSYEMLFFLDNNNIITCKI